MITKTVDKIQETFESTVRQVARGDRITATQNGVRIFALIPIDDLQLLEQIVDKKD